jgi:hypothetical protein
MSSASESMPSDLVAAHAMILAERTARLEAEAKLANARAEAALIAPMGAGYVPLNQNPL